jgi:hypothetical protein
MNIVLLFIILNGTTINPCDICYHGNMNIGMLIDFELHTTTK